MKTTNGQEVYGKINNINNHRQYVHAKSLQSCPTLRDPMDHSPPLSSVHGILQARILEWIAKLHGIFPTPSLNLLSPMSPALADGFFTTSTTWEAINNHQGKMQGKITPSRMVIIKKH